MTAELVATQLLIAWSIFAFFFSLFFIRMIISRYDIDELKAEFEEIVNERLQTAIDSIGEAFGEILSEPTVKKAFSIIGSQGGDAKAENQLIDTMAVDILDGPQFGAIKIAASAMGIDIEDYIEKHGAVKTLKSARQLAGLVGIDIMNVDLGSLAIPGAGTSGGNYYLRRK